MREVLFRAKRSDNGEWIYGFYCCYGHVKQEKSYIMPDCASDLCVVEIIPGTLGQYIGLTDRYDVKIFEGDIVRWTDSAGSTRNFLVAWDKYRNSFYLRSWGYNVDFYDCCAEELTVIGNIYDDPKPLKGE